MSPIGCGCGGANKNQDPPGTWVITRPDGTTYKITGTEFDARVQRVRNGGGSFAEQK